MNQILLSPLFLGITLALVLWGWGRRLPPWLRTLGGVLLGACVLLTTPLGAGALERAVLLPPTPCATTPQAIVVLGGGALERAPEGDFRGLSLASLRRTLAGTALWQATGGRLIMTGGSFRGSEPEARRMAALAHALGVPEAALQVEPRARTTWENAMETARLTPAPPHAIWLVTSAVHLRRARYAFTRAGFTVCPVPADADLAPASRPWRALLPAHGALIRTDAALHELVGLAWYRLRAPFAPSPEPAARPR